MSPSSPFASRSPLVVPRCIAASVLFAVIALFAVTPPAAQLSSTWIDLSDRVGPPDHPFGVNVSPDGAYYHVAIAGSFSAPNSLVAVIERRTRQVVARFPVGRFPEDVAYTVTAGMPPKIDAIFVTNSSDGTVSVLDAQGSPIGTIPLGASSYPFGIAIDGSERWGAVTTKSGSVFLIDVPTRSVVKTLSVTGGHGRPVFLPDGRVAFASTESDFIRKITTISAHLVDPTGVRLPVVARLHGPVSGYPSSEDVALVEEGRELWFPLLNADKTIQRVDAATGRALGSLSLAGTYPGPGVGSLHGIAASGEGHALVTAFNAGHVALLRTSPPGVLATLGLTLGIQPNEVVFTPDAREACVTMQANAAGVHVIDGLPTPRLRIETAGAERGKPFRFTVRGARAFSSSVVAMSLTGKGPTVILGETVRLTAPIMPLAVGAHDATGRFVASPLAIPDEPALRGRVVHMQAMVQAPDLSLRVSEPLTIVVK